ncbi:MAG: BamA/TamA family outer membrane protein [candidate division Zixibacteria bacterium]|nr:BamA/TamA family outer membrane protein [candidate division Zixibacteria bacterium]
MTRIAGYIVILLGIFIMSGSAFAQVDDPLYERWIRKKPRIDSILIEVNDGSYYAKGKIRSSLFSRTSDLWRSIKSDRRIRIQRETLMRDTSEVKYLYLSAGFLGVSVRETFEAMPPDSSALVRVRIEEGRQFVYGRVEINGSFDSKFAHAFHKIGDRFKSNEPVDPFALKQATYDIKSILANDGYPYATAEYAIDTTVIDNHADVAFFIDADSLVHFGKVNILGAGRFHESLARREITFKPGDVYQRKDIIESQKRLLQTGNYLTLQLYSAARDSANGADRLNPDFILSLREKKPHYVSIKTGAAQDSIKDLTWTLSGSWGKRNILRSRRLELSAEVSSVIFTEWRIFNHSYTARFVEPWFLGLRMPLTLTASVSPEIQDRVESYRIGSWRLAASTTRELGNKINILMGFEYKSVKISGLSDEDQILLKQDEELSNRRKLYLTVQRDSRDNILMPTDGSLSRMNVEYVGGFLSGDNSYTYSEASWSRYRKVWPGWIQATRIKGGYVKEFGSSETVPVDARFYIGGANSVRGFKENLLGPLLEEEKPEGANSIIIVNHEYRYPIFGKFWGSIFGDMGNGFRNRDEIAWNHLAISYGLGFQFISPAGPIRVDYARRARTAGYTSGYRFHFTILYAF